MPPSTDFRIESYAEHRRVRCLQMLRSNVPEYFIATDEEEFAAFLRAPGDYFVVANTSGEVIACGGIGLWREPSVAILCWGLVDAAYHRRGIGSLLLRFRLETFLPRHPDVRVVRAHTTQRVQSFFGKHGFAVLSATPDGFGPGLDRVVMERQVMP